ncbi:hypothetical protein [Nonomuraea bangladeshensis]|uniref:hypothetical protein n=1 Tax=Nonomuraea bangladeshensis TaxID=404385 RepID=UPI003C2DD0C9
MAWEWVAPVMTGVSGIVGVGFTWYAGHQGRQHAERVAAMNSTATLQQAREARRATAYLEAMTTVQNATVAVSDMSSTIKLLGEQVSSIPSPEEQIAARARVALYGSEIVRITFAQWLGHFNQALNLVEMREISDGDLSDLPTLKDELRESSQSMRDVARQLSDVMNKELAS